MAPLFTLPPTCRSWSPTGRYSTIASLLRETCCCATSNLPLGVTNEGREAIKPISGAVAEDSKVQQVDWSHQLPSQKKFLAPLPGTPVYKIGELHTIFYLCFLVLFVYLSVFVFESYGKQQQNERSLWALPWVRTWSVWRENLKAYGALLFA